MAQKFLIFIYSQNAYYDENSRENNLILKQKIFYLRLVL